LPHIVRQRSNTPDARIFSRKWPAIVHPTSRAGRKGFLGVTLNINPPEEFRA
jgi:hypothetical protein